MRENKIEVLLTPSDSTLASYAACVGWLIGTVSLSSLEKNRQPFGRFALAQHGREDMLLRFMIAWHEAFEVTK